MKAIVVGAGMGGLTTALALHKAGIQVRVFESVRDIKPLGVGINVLPNAMRVLEALGLLEQMKQAGHPAPGTDLLQPHGQPFMTEPRGLGAGYRVPSSRSTAARRR